MCLQWFKLQLNVIIIINKKLDNDHFSIIQQIKNYKQLNITYLIFNVDAMKCVKNMPPSPLY